MELNNPLYKNQGIHVVINLFTVYNNEFKVLLIKRKNEPFLGKWSLPSGAVYNNEDLDKAVIRELKEKTGIDNVTPKMFNIFSDPKRAPQMRMLGIAYLAVIDASAMHFISETQKSSEVAWFNINDVPELSYDHNVILKDSIDYLKKQIFTTDIIKTLFPKYVTIPVLQNVYEKILGRRFDRRNFRKKLINTGLIKYTGKLENVKGKKPSKLYKISKIAEDISL